MSVTFENVQQSANIFPLDTRYGDRTQQQSRANPLDSVEAVARLRILQDWWTETRHHHTYNRYEQAVDEDFYDGMQWRDDDVEVLAERGQAASTFNVVAQHINWILGTERRTRVDFRVLSRDGQDEKGARNKTAVLKYLTDVNKGAFARSAAFADAVKVGVGWLEDGARSDPFDEPIFSRRESWRNIWWDALSVEPDLSDARYLFRVRWTDTDIAKAMFPKRVEAVIHSARSDDLLHFEDDSEMMGYTGLYGQPMSDRNTLATGTSFMDSTFNIGTRRMRNKLIECWYRIPVKVQVMRPQPMAILDQGFQDDLIGLSGTEYDASNPAMAELVQSNICSVFDAVRMKVRCAIWSGNYLLQDVQSCYRHDRFPFTPIWAYRRGRDNLPYGPIRNMRDPQEDLNKRRSKALFLISVNQLLADDDAFEDWDEAADEVSRPDGVLKKKRGSDVEIIRNIELAKEHVDLMQQDMSFLQSASGVTEENRGEVTNTNSGAAIDKRQTQGSVVTAMLFDNLRHSIQLQGETQLSLVEQFMAEPKIIRLTDRRGMPQYTKINYPNVNENGYLDIENPITSGTGEFIVDAQAFKESQRAAMFDQGMTALQGLDKQHQIALLDLVYENSDVPNKDEWVRRIRRINKEIDPDAPDRDQQEAARNAQDAATADRQARLIESDIALKTSTADKAGSQATTARGDTMMRAAEIMALLAADPALARAVDILTDAFQQPNNPALPEASLAVAAGPTEPVATPGGANAPKAKQPTPGSATANAKSSPSP
jgi:hypothetical protein